MQSGECKAFSLESFSVSMILNNVGKISIRVRAHTKTSVILQTNLFKQWYNGEIVSVMGWYELEWFLQMCVLLFGDKY